MLIDFLFDMSTSQLFEFLKLEKVEFGGLRGRSLSEAVQEMFTDFNDMVQFQLSGQEL